MAPRCSSEPSAALHRAPSTDRFAAPFRLQVGAREATLERMPGQTDEKLVLLGLDSVDVDWVRAHLGSLPNLRRLFGEGAVRRLASPGDVMSGSVWPTFYTATDPGEHGQYFPMQWDPASMRLRHVGPEWIDCEPFWRPLARAGLPVTTLDLQCAFPARTSDGVEVVNWGVEAFGGFHCNRADVGRDILRRFGHDAMRFDAPVDKSPSRLTTMRRRLLASVERRGDLARWLMRETDWRLFLAVFTEGHRAGHYFWPEEDGENAATAEAVLVEVHRAIDAEIGRLLESIDLRTTTLVVFSLLGMEANRSQMHFVQPVLDRVNAAFARSVGERTHPQRGIMRPLRRLLPAALQERIALAVPERVRDWVIGRAFTGGLDWRRTPAFALPTGGEGYVRLNLAGRERDGCLAGNGERHRHYVALLEDGLRELRDAHTGEPLVADIRHPTEQFGGPRRHQLPDVSIAWRPRRPATAVRGERLGAFTGRLATGRAGNHRAAAFAAIAGPAQTAPRVATLDTIVDLGRFVRDRVAAAGA